MVIAQVPSPSVPYGLVVRIPAFHAGGPGSIPGVGGVLDEIHLLRLSRPVLELHPGARNVRRHAR